MFAQFAGGQTFDIQVMSSLSLRFLVDRTILAKLRHYYLTNLLLLCTVLYCMLQLLLLLLLFDHCL